MEYCCWVCDLNAINVCKNLKFVMYSRPMVDNPLSLVALPTFVIDTFVWSIPKSLDLKLYKLRNRLNLTLMLLCRFLFVGFKWMQWIGLPASTFGETCETKGYLCSIDSFSKILWNPKLRWQFRIKYICQLYSFLFLKTSCDTLDSKLNVIWNLSNIL